MAKKKPAGVPITLQNVMTALTSPPTAQTTALLNQIANVGPAGLVPPTPTKPKVVRARKPRKLKELDTRMLKSTWASLVEMDANNTRWYHPTNKRAEALKALVSYGYLTSVQVERVWWSRSRIEYVGYVVSAEGKKKIKLARARARLEEERVAKLREATVALLHRLDESPIPSKRGVKQMLGRLNKTLNETNLNITEDDVKVFAVTEVLDNKEVNDDE